MSNEEKQPEKKHPEEEKQSRERKKRKPKQRGHGEGSIFYREDRDEWVAQITLENRKTKQRYRKTRSEAAQALQGLLHEQRQGRLATGRKQTVEQYLKYWLEIHRAILKESTYAMYRRHLNNHILPHLGHYQLQQLTIDQVQAFYAKKQQEKISAGTIRSFHAILYTALKDAVRWKRLSYNVCERVTPPRISRHDTQVLDQTQAKQLLAAAKGSSIECLLTLALATGLRLGELLALRWSDINVEEGILQVRHTVDYIQGHGYLETEPKTESGKRTVALPPFVLDTLRQHRTTQLEARLQAGSEWKEQGLVFTNRRGGYLGRTPVRNRFNALLKQAGLPHMRFHDLRHSAATILLSMRVDAKVVQGILGHAHISITLGIYGHTLPSMQRDAMNQMGDLLGGEK